MSRFLRRFHNGSPQLVLQPPPHWAAPVSRLVALFLHVWPIRSLEAPSSGHQSSRGEGWAMQIPQLLQAVRKHTVSNDIIEGDRAPESCPNRFPGNVYL